MNEQTEGYIHFSDKFENTGTNNCPVQIHRHFMSEVLDMVSFEFIIGTCKGLFEINDETVEIFAIMNRKPNNGHFEDVLEWFTVFTQKYSKEFYFSELTNDSFAKHLVNKRGFEWHGNKLKKKTDG